jgi:hypothetical protein
LSCGAQHTLTNKWVAAIRHGRYHSNLIKHLIDLERIRRKEIRELDTYKTISLLCGSADYTKPPYAPKPWSGLIEQQRLFKKLAGRE